MLLYILIAQRIESYPGEYAPEALSVMTEHDKENNEEYMSLIESEMRANNEFDRLAWVTTMLADIDIESRLLNGTALEWHDGPRPKGQYVVRSLIARRKGRYLGEYGVQALAVMDEYGMNENPDYLQEQAEEAINSQEFTALGYLDIGLNRRAIRTILYPETTPIPGTIL